MKVNVSSWFWPVPCVKSSSDWTNRNVIMNVNAPREPSTVNTVKSHFTSKTSRWTSGPKISVSKEKKKISYKTMQCFHRHMMKSVPNIPWSVKDAPRRKSPEKRCVNRKYVTSKREDWHSLCTSLTTQNQTDVGMDAHFLLLFFSMLITSSSAVNSGHRADIMWSAVICR